MHISKILHSGKLVYGLGREFNSLNVITIWKYFYDLVIKKKKKREFWNYLYSS